MGLIAAIFNPWWVKIYEWNQVLGLLFFGLGILTIIFYRRNNELFLILLTGLLLIVQINFTKQRDLYKIANDDKRLIDLRLGAYPPIKELPIAYWLEMKGITVASKRMAESFFENLDPNQYFFANHPRERVGHVEIQKMPFFFLPLAIIGLVVLGYKFKRLLWINLLGLIILSYYGNDFQFGTIILYPILLISIDEGGRCLKKFF